MKSDLAVCHLNFQIAQPIRLLLAYVQEDYEDKRYQCGPGKRCIACSICFCFNLSKRNVS